MYLSLNSLLLFLVIFLLLLTFCLCLTDRLPYSIRILLESAIRNCDNFQVKKEDVEKILDWENTAPKQVEIPFKPARVLLQVLHSTSWVELSFAWSTVEHTNLLIDINIFYHDFVARTLQECQLWLTWL